MKSTAAERTSLPSLYNWKVWLNRVLHREPVGPGPFRTSSQVLDHYVAEMPSHQNAIDAVPGWVGAMPPETGLRAGDYALYTDERVAWMLTHYPVAEKLVLELGPLEGFHTHMLHQAGAMLIDAIEANTLAFLRCLVTKEVLRLNRAYFFLGDFMTWLQNNPRRYDLIMASGVLYHSHDPIQLLELIAERSDAFFLWTHYFDDTVMPPGDLRRVPFSEAVETRQCRGVTVRLHERSYYKAWRDPAFCGGIQDRHFWIDRADILNLIAAFGFDRVLIEHEEPAHVNGPSFSIFAERTKGPRDQEPGASTDAPAPEPADVEHVAASPASPAPADVEPTAAAAVAPALSAPEPADAEHVAVPPASPTLADVEPTADAAAAPASPAPAPAPADVEPAADAVVAPVSPAPEPADVEHVAVPPASPAPADVEPTADAAVAPAQEEASPAEALVMEASPSAATVPEQPPIDVPAAETPAAVGSHAESPPPPPPPALQPQAEPPAVAAIAAERPVGEASHEPAGAHDAAAAPPAKLSLPVDEV